MVLYFMMSDRPNDDPKKSAERVVRYQEKFNVPVQTEEEEAESHENAEVEHLADEEVVRKEKEGTE